MKRYFSRITANHWTSKNNAHKEALKAAGEMDRRIIDEDLIDRFTEDFKQKIDLINQYHKRCKNLELNYRKQGKDFVFNISEVFSLTLFLANDDDQH